MERKHYSLFKNNLTRLALVSYVSEMRRLLADCRTCLDVGCGSFSPTCYIDFELCVGLDGYEPTLAAAKRKRTHNEYVLANAPDIGRLFSDKEFDCCVALDVIEHLPKEAGYRLLRDMERIASKKVLVFTPNGFLPQHDSNGDLQEHRSGWEVEDFDQLGYYVIGIHGPKFLRGEQHRHKIRPKAVGGVVTEILHYAYTRRHPEKSAALLAVKSLA